MKGYKPGQVNEIIGVTNETLRYWRKNLYPKISQDYFSLADIFMFHFIKAYVKGRRVKVSELSDINWNEIHTTIKSMSPKNKNSCISVFNFNTKKHRFVHSVNEVDLSDYELTFVYLKSVIKDFNLSIQAFGNSSHNIISLDTGFVVEAS